MESAHLEATTWAMKPGPYSPLSTTLGGGGAVTTPLPHAQASVSCTCNCFSKRAGTYSYTTVLEVAPTTPGTDAQLLGDRVVHLASGSLGPAGRTLAALVQRLPSPCLGVFFSGLLAPQLLLDSRQPLGPPAEDMPLQGSRLRLERRQPLAQLLGLLAPGAEMVQGQVTGHAPVNTLRPR
jgi:hypothetical protein